jgi:hypothetical protein
MCPVDIATAGSWAGVGLVNNNNNIFYKKKKKCPRRSSRRGGLENEPRRTNECVKVKAKQKVVRREMSAL